MVSRRPRTTLKLWDTDSPPTRWEREREARPERALVSGDSLLHTGMIGEPQRVKDSPCANATN